MVEGLFSFLFYCESGINQYAVPKTLADVIGGESVITSARLPEIGCTAIPFKNASSCFMR